MLRDPFSRPQAGFGGGNVYEPEPGLNDPGGVGFGGRLGNIRPRGMQTGGGMPAQPMNPGPLPPTMQPGFPMQTGGPGQMQPLPGFGQPMRTGGPMAPQQAPGMDPATIAALIRRRGF